MSTTPFFIQVLTVLDIIMFFIILWAGLLPEGLVPRGPRPIDGATFRRSLRGRTYSEIRTPAYVLPVGYGLTDRRSWR